MKRIFRIVHEQARQNAIKALVGLEVREEKPEVVTIEREQKNRSLSQNKRYWAFLQNAALTSGVDAEALHHVCKKRFLGYAEIEVFGAVQEIPNSTARLNTQQFTDYVDQVEQFLVEQGLLI